MPRMSDSYRKRQAKKFTQLLSDLGVNQKECGALIGRTAQTVNNYANGHTFVHSTVWDKLESLRKCSAFELKARAKSIMEGS